MYADLTYKKQSYGQLTIYSYHENNIDIKQQIAFLKTDPLYRNSSKTRVYFIHNRPLFTWLLSPATFPNAILNFINHTNLITRGVTFGSLVFFNSEIQNSNHIRNDIAHELVHVLQSRKYGVFATLYSTPSWINEGYATYRTHIFNNQPIDLMDVNIKYKRSAKLIKHAIENMDIAADDLHRGRIKYEEIILSFCQTKYVKQCDNTSLKY